MECEQQGQLTPATEVDHITPINEAWDLRLDWDNLQSLCKPCHSRKTMQENGDKIRPGPAIDPMAERLRSLLK